MIFWRQSLFRFSRHLLGDMLIFITRCSNFFFHSSVAGFALERRRLRLACRRAGRAAGGTPPIENINHSRNERRTTANQSARYTGAQPKHSLQSRFERRGRI